MPVAKTYTNWRRDAEPIIDNGKSYIMVYHPSTQKPKRVRWYTDVEYAKMYNLPTVEVKNVPVGANPEQKRVLGFSKGYITIFKGDQIPHLEWFKKSVARYHKVWKWYVVSEDEVPADLPEGIEPIRLDWEMVSDNDIMKSNDAIAAIVEAMMYGDSPSEFQGSIGSRLEVVLTVERAIPVEGAYGTSTVHIMHDDFENVYVWITAAKTLSAGTAYLIRGSVKDHKVFKGVKQTVLTRCKVMEEYE